MKALWWLVGALLLALPSVGAAQAGRTLDASWNVDPHPGTPVQDPDAVADLGAARRYLEREIRPSDPTRYRVLDPELTHLESMTEAADGVVWTTVSLTAGSLGTAIALAAVEQRESAAILFGLSGGVLVVGLLIQAIFRPSRDDVANVFRIPR
ncbi:MAG TPA: hypothetical protein RMH99_23300 [Sandaracinaceae bacterium LLY-WYZ-13_1]|nr:hypothetical protein [Sandaracinaceae bacterium LLY-WYZ-13_1]